MDRTKTAVTILSVIILALALATLPVMGCSQNKANTESQPQTPGAVADTGSQPQTPKPANNGAQPQTPRTATFVVAAADSLPQSQAHADYACDGVDDQVEIQKAIDALPASGGKVVLLEGTYLLSNSIKIRHDNIALEGSNSVLKLDSGYASVLATNASSGQDQVVVNDASGFRIGMGVWIKDDKHCGYDSTLCTITKIEGNVLALNTNLGGSHTTADNAVVTNMFRFLDIDASDNYLQPTEDRLHSISIQGIVFNGNSDNTSVGGSFAIPMVYVQNTYGLDISGCTFTHSFATAITLDGNTEGVVSNCLFEDFPLRSPERAAEVVHLSGGNIHVTVSNNVFRDINTHGIYFCQHVTGCIVANNILEGGSGPLCGIKVGAPSDFNNLIEGNIIKSFYSGIEDMGVRTTIADNIILNTAGHGIFIFDGHSALISGNQLAGVDHSGIEIYTSHCLITNNRVEGCGQVGSEYAGIRLQQGASYNTVSSNLVRKGSSAKVPGYGIWLKPSADNNLVINNDVYDSGTVNLRDEGANNIIKNNRGYDL